MAPPPPNSASAECLASEVGESRVSSQRGGLVSVAGLSGVSVSCYKGVFVYLNVRPSSVDLCDAIFSFPVCLWVKGLPAVPLDLLVR